eukprot:tig00001095_g7034.t1
MSRNHGHSGGLARFLVRPGQYSFVRAGSSSARPGAPVVTFVPAYETEGPSLMANEDRVPLLSAAPNPASVAGAPAGAANSTASLFDALNKGDINAVRKMLDQGQPVNAKVDDPMQMDDRGQLPIHAAACSGSQIFWHLLELGIEADEKKLPDRLHKCTELTKNDVLDTWHAEQVYERQMKKIEQEPAFSKALDQEGPLFDSVDILEHRLPGIGSPLDIAIELNLYSFMGHPFVHRYIQRISESASEMQVCI